MVPKLDYLDAKEKIRNFEEREQNRLKTLSLCLAYFRELDKMRGKHIVQRSG
jgi:hypothetical protein